MAPCLGHHPRHARLAMAPIDGPDRWPRYCLWTVSGPKAFVGSGEGSAPRRSGTADFRHPTGTVQMITAVGHARPVLFVLSCVMVFPLASSAQTSSARANVITAAGERYRAGPVHRLVLGRHYRDLWTTPIEVEVLDLSTFAGGITPLRRGGGLSTRALRFLGSEGGADRAVLGLAAGVAEDVNLGRVLFDRRQG